MAQSIITKRALAAALKTQMRKKPFPKITIEDICSCAGISRRNFYRHFKDKYELVAWSFYDEFCSDIEGQEGWTVWDYFPHICRHLYADRMLYINAYSEEGQNSFREYCTSRLYPILMHDFGSAFENEDDAHFYIDRLTNASFDGFVRWLTSEPCMPPDKYAQKVQRNVTQLAAGIARLGGGEQNS